MRGGGYLKNSLIFHSHNCRFFCFCLCFLSTLQNIIWRSFKPHHHRKMQHWQFIMLNAAQFIMQREFVMLSLSCWIHSEFMLNERLTLSLTNGIMQNLQILIPDIIHLMNWSLTIMLTFQKWLFWVFIITGGFSPTCWGILINWLRVQQFPRKQK